MSADGPLLVDSDGGPVTLRGATARGLQNPQPRGSEFVPALDPAAVAEMRDWGLTAVAIPIAQDIALDGRDNATAEAYLRALDATIAAATEAGLYSVVQLALVSATVTAPEDGVGELDRPLPDNRSVDLWGVLANRYTRQQAVIFDLFRSPRDPDPADPTAALLPRIGWPLWRGWLLAMLGAVRREHPAALIVVRGLHGGADLSGFPLRRTDGSEPANLLYAAEDATALPELERLGTEHPVGLLGWRAEQEDALAVEAMGRRLARLGHHWIAASWEGGAAPLAARQSSTIRPTPLGRAFRAAAAQPVPPAANLDPANRRAQSTRVNQLVPGSGAIAQARRHRRRRPPPPTVVRVLDERLRPRPGIVLRLIAPGGPHAGTPVTTDGAGRITVPARPTGESKLASPQWELMPATAATQDYAPTEIVISGGGPVDPTYDLPVRRGSVSDVVARRAYYLECPGCGRTFKTVKPAVAGHRNVCPGDGTDLTAIEARVETNLAAFTTPPTGQTPSSAPTTLTARGSRRLVTAHGNVTVCWDETRFLSPTGGDYVLWGQPAVGPAGSVRVIGRATWGASAPLLTAGRLWEFHEAALGASPAYATVAIPRSENRRLATVMFWMTVHHTTDTGTSAFATPRRLQHKHQTARGYADIGYHFVIDANGAIYEGRPLGIEGSHTELFNAGNIGIALAGDFEPRAINLWTPDRPTPAAIAALETLVEVIAARFAVRSVWTHQKRKNQAGAGATECPGEKLIPAVTALRTRFPGPPA